MPSVYLESADYATYGVPNATTAQIIKASAIIDGYLDKPDGLIYTADIGGNPVAMANTGLPITVYQAASGSLEMMLSYNPVVALLSVEYNSVPGLPPIYTTIDGSVFSPDGQVWLSLQIPIRTDLRIKYVAGWLYATLPSAIKMACANIAMMLADSIESGAIQSVKAGDTQIIYNKALPGGSVYIDASMSAMLSPYRRVFA